MNNPFPPQNNPALPKDLAARMKAIVEKHAAEYRKDVPSLLKKMLKQTQCLSDAEKWREAMPLLKREAHDMKGQASTFGLPSMSVVSKSLCRVLDHGRYEDAAYASVVTTHVAALVDLLNKDDEALVISVLEKASLMLDSNPRPYR